MVTMGHMEPSCDAFLAHTNPDELLVDHLEQVGEACKRRISELISDDKLSTVADITGKTHDFGKYNLFFQQKIRSVKRGSGELYSHAPLSAAYCAYAIQGVTNDFLLSLIGSFSVWFHHQSLEMSLGDYCSKIGDFYDNQNYSRQIETIERNIDKIESDIERLGLPPIDGFIQFAKEGRFHQLANDMYHSIPSSSNFQLLYRVLLLFSTLIDSDKRLAAHMEFPRQNTGDFFRILGDNLANFISGLKSSNEHIREIRSEIRASVLNQLQNLLKLREIPKLLYINAPTGTGKTLLSFDCALRLSEEIKGRTGKNPRVVYVLPYINIIDQTYDILSKVLDVKGESYQDDHIIKHHHLYAPGKKADNFKEVPNEKRMALIESWDSDIVVTTFVQFIETLVGTRNKMLKKFNKILDSIIILDEIQAFRPEYWEFVVECLKELPDTCHVIMMSATMPRFFSEVARPLLLDSFNHFAKMNRTKYEYIEEDMNNSDLVDFILNRWDKGSVLVVANTIRTSIEIYTSLKERLKDSNPVCLRSAESEKLSGEGDRPLLAYISTNIIPKHRLSRIQILNEELRKSRPIILVSTQVVEAGVDLDFGTVVREIAPLDSIVQSGGRCNRSWNRHMGTVYIVKLRNGERYNWEYVYSPLSIKKLTIPLFEHKKVLEEKELWTDIFQYYDKKTIVESLVDSDESREYIDAARRVEFARLVGLKLIKDDPKASAFVNLDQESQRRLDCLRNIIEEKGKKTDRDYSIRNRLRFAWTSAQEFMVDTWDSKFLPLEELIPGEEYAAGVKLIDTDELERYYDLETGLKTGDHLDGFIF